jgi:hypothetical protein
LLPLLNTADNGNMTVDLFLYYSSKLSSLVKTSPTPADLKLYDDIIKRVVSYTDLMMKNNLATTAS